MVKGYLDHLVVERGLARNTVAAYRRDLARYAAWLTQQGIDDIADVHSSDIEAYQMSLASGDAEHPALATSSIARMIVAVRALHAFAAAESLTPDSPAADAWSGRTGFAHAALMADLPDLSGHEVYACGSPAMIDAARADLTGRCGLPPEAFFADAFSFSNDTKAA